MRTYRNAEYFREAESRKEAKESDQNDQASCNHESSESPGKSCHRVCEEGLNHVVYRGIRVFVYLDSKIKC